MTFDEVIDGLAARFSIDGLADDNGTLLLRIDGMDVSIAPGNGGAFVATGFVCDAPPERGETFANMLLDATIGLMDSRSAALARNPESKSYVLVERIPANCGMDGFCDALKQFADTLEDLASAAANFRPAAEEAAARDEKASEFAKFGANGPSFMSV